MFTKDINKCIEMHQYLTVLYVIVVPYVDPGPVRNLTFAVDPSGNVIINWVEPIVSNAMIVAYELIYTIIGEESMSAENRSNSEAEAKLQGLGWL